jgi:hypothetical protein
MWRMKNFNGGFLNEVSLTYKGKDPIIESIYKGTEVVEDEKTVERSFERRKEKRR